MLQVLEKKEKKINTIFLNLKEAVVLFDAFVFFEFRIKRLHYVNRNVT